MEEEQKKVPLMKYTIWASSWQCKKPGANCVGVNEKIVTEWSDGSKTSENNLKLYEDPMRPFWVTKPQFRNHEFKKEFGDIDKCEMTICPDSQLEERLEYVLGLTPSHYRKRSLRQLCDNPFVYGADIDIQTLIKQNYTNKAPKGKLAQFTRGCLDIEAEPNGEHRINCITFIHEYEIFTVALRCFCRFQIDDGTFKNATENDCAAVREKMLGAFLRAEGEHKKLVKRPFTITATIKDTELECIEWIFEKIKEKKTDFIGIWNLGYDIPHILKRIETLGGDPAQIMCHPDVPIQYRFVNFFQDNSEAQHFTDKWHWVSIAGYSQFIDSMCLYARLRKVSGRDSSYGLDYISEKEIGTGKLHFGAITNHWYAQNFKFLEYWVYNINDCVIMQLMEFKNNDMSALAGLTSMSLLSQFSRQTTMVRNNAYNYGKQHGKVPAAAGTTMFTKFDSMQLKGGGAVLPAEKAIGIGIPAVRGSDYPTQVVLSALDLDFSSYYPSTISCFNISKETLLATVFNINGHPQTEVEEFISNAIHPETNAVHICRKFYGLPSYREMEKRYLQHCRTVIDPRTDEKRELDG